MTKYKNYEAELNSLLSYVLEVSASDLHLIAGKPPVVRVDSRLAPAANYDVYDAEEIERIIAAILTETHQLRLQKDRQVDFSYAFKNNARFRVNVYYQQETIAAAFRYISSKIRTLEELNLPKEIAAFTEYQQGLVLVVGPTGHGKSTTLAALIDKINKEQPDHIITIEDPIEYVFLPEKSLISQREVYKDTPDFPHAIRATLREDADVVMIGEMRDLESIAATVTVAETGHLVFATLHTNDSAQTVDRIIDVFPPHQQNQIRSQLASILIGVVSQRLIPRVGGGRVPVIELMFNNNAIRNIIREGRTYEINNVIHTSAQLGMTSLDKSLADLTRRGVIKLEDAVGYASDKELFKSLVKRI